MKNQIIHGDCLEEMKTLPDNSVDAIVTDPPYGLSFMGKKWDYDVPSQEIWEECLRVLKPGGYLLAFAGTRTQHRMAVRIEDAGFEIRDIIAWVYGSGFPKSRNIGLDLDKRNGVTKNRGKAFVVAGQSGQKDKDTGGDLVPGSNDMGAYVAQNEWSGWGTALKPALEPITVARKPLSEKTVAENVLKWGTGGINIDGSRVKMKNGDKKVGGFGNGGIGFGGGDAKGVEWQEKTEGRFPANLIHDGSDEVVGLFPNTGKGNGGKPYNYSGKEYDNKDTSMFNGDKPQAPSNFNDSGSAARFFYCAKASKSERNRGCEGLEEKQTVGGGGGIGDYLDDVNSASGKYGSEKAPNKNNHPTVKPIALMEYLVKLVSREGSLVLDPFAGSGSTLLSCKNLGRNYIGIEREQEYIDIINKRLSTVYL